MSDYGALRKATFCEIERDLNLQLLFVINDDDLSHDEECTESKDIPSLDDTN